MSIQECLEKIESQRPKKRMPADKLAKRMALLLKVIEHPAQDPTEQYARLKAALLCGSLKK